MDFGLLVLAAALACTSGGALWLTALSRRH